MIRDFIRTLAQTFLAYEITQTEYDWLCRELKTRIRP